MFENRDQDNIIVRNNNNLDPEFKIYERKSKSLELITPSVSATLDRCNVTPRKACAIIGSVSSVLGHKSHEVVLSTSTVWRKRAAHRETAYFKLKESFNSQGPFIIHWDGKMLPDIMGTGAIVDRLAILVTGNGVDQLLGVPAISTSTGKNQATAVVNCIHEWNLEHVSKGICFDTTASNTGRYHFHFKI